MRKKSLFFMLVIVPLFFVAFFVVVSQNTFVTLSPKGVIKVQIDMLKISKALEYYYDDNNLYPLAWDKNGIFVPCSETTKTSFGFIPRSLTTPIAYEIHIPVDSFNLDEKAGYKYMTNFVDWWLLISNGPDAINDIDFELLSKVDNFSGNRTVLNILRSKLYDPTNGANSKGDIVEFYLRSETGNTD